MIFNFIQNTSSFVTIWWNIWVCFSQFTQINYRYHLKDAVLDGGIPFNKAYGMSAFEYHGKDPRFNKVFNQGMSNHSTIIMKKILQIYDGFEGLNTVVDVGGGTGATLNMIISKHPSIKGINFDLPHVIEDAPSYQGLLFIIYFLNMFIYWSIYISNFLRWVVFNLLWCQVWSMLVEICLWVCLKEMPFSWRWALSYLMVFLEVFKN